MDPIPMPAPYLGVNELVPTIAIQSPNCQKLLNFNVTREGVTLRNGDKKAYYFQDVSNSYHFLRLFTYIDTKLFALVYSAVDNTVYVVDVEGSSFAYGVTPGEDEFYSLYFNKYLFFWGLNIYKTGFSYNGAAYAVGGYTGTGINPAGGDVFNRRAYLIQYNDASYWYTEIDAIAGACTKVNLNSIILEFSKLAIIAPITISDNVSTVIFQAFVFFSGEVLFYSGSYPDSSDWTLLGRAKIGRPLNYSGGIAYQGDYLVFTDVGVVSLRDLFLKGSEEGSSLTLSANVQDSWKDLVKAIRSYLSNQTGRLLGVVGVWDRINDRIIISFPYYLDDTGTIQSGSFYFIFYNQLKSWFFHRSFGNGVLSMLDLVAYKNKVYSATNTYTNSSAKLMIYEKEGATGFTDRTYDDTSESGYDFQILSAPISNGRAYVQKVEGMDIIIKSDLHDVNSYQLVKDFGVDTTAAQVISGVPSGSLQKPYANIGIEGSYIQYKMSGTTVTGKTVGTQVYGTNIWVNQGGSPR